MKPFRSVLAGACVVAAFAVVVPAAHADPLDGVSANGAGTCGTSSGNEGQGGTAGTNNQVCLSAGMVAIGSSVGQNASVVGPAIAPGSVVTGPIIVSAGDAAVNGAVV
jgi:hypothetical protein